MRIFKDISDHENWLLVDKVTVNYGLVEGIPQLIPITPSHADYSIYGDVEIMEITSCIGGNIKTLYGYDRAVYTTEKDLLNAIM